MFRLTGQSEMLDEIHVEIHRRIQTHQKVSDMRYGFNPMRPLPFVLTGKSQKFVNVWDPLDRVTKYENQDDSQTDFGQSHLIGLVLVTRSSRHIILQKCAFLAIEIIRSGIRIRFLPS